MDFRIARLLFACALFLSVLLAAPMFSVSNHGKVTPENPSGKTAIGSHPTIVLVGDPVGGGIPNGNQTGNGTG